LNLRTKVIEEMNLNARKAFLHHSAPCGGSRGPLPAPVEWVRVPRPRAHPREDSCEHANGILVKITAVSILEPEVVLEEECRELLSHRSTTSAASWRGRGRAPDLTQSKGSRSIVQVIVDLGGGEEARLAVFAANKVIRLGAAARPNPIETELLRFSFVDGGVPWIRAALAAPSTRSPSASALPASSSSSAGSGHASLRCLADMDGRSFFRHMAARAAGPYRDWVSLAQDPAAVVAVRDGFRASEGFVLLAADYSQIELRLLTHFCADEGLCTAFRCGQDVFKTIAARWRGKMEAEVSAEERTLTKQICYALIYGAGPSLIAQQAGVSEKEAQTMTEDFLRRHPQVKKFIAQTKVLCRRNGFVETLLGRRSLSPICVVA
jgi:hypothetical protein